jgi:serine/threonine protein kinase/Tfp pilus assembly protein PilF
MTPERWQQIDNLLQSALACASEERPAFLAQACAGDEPLRLEVESLLASHEHSGNLLETPLSQIAADLFVESQPASVEGKTIGLYKVLARLGAGGMGEVYLAQDPRLDRKIALKLLPAYFTKDANRLHRFEQEARAASSLNHPNILTIYEIGRADSHHFIATEFIDGVTLRERLTSTPMKLSEALEIAVQVAAALTAAHAANIVHRDIKPENIMIRDDGYVKVLDFGLAKLTERPASTIDTEAATRALVKTNPGMVMGTVQYMSPEQARGVPVDERTDIWSLGAVLYEMAAGRVPFEGETATDVILSVVEREPPPLARYSREVPAELERIVNKALRKNREERYQTVKDLSLDLKNLKQELEAFGVPAGGWLSDAKTAPPEGGTPNEGTLITRPGTLNTHPTSSAEYIVNEIKSHKRSVVLALATLVIAVAATVYFFYFAKGGEAIDSVAVMPFVNVSGDPNTEYLSDGMSESIINSLSQLPNLKKVIALNTVLRYKGKQTDPQAVGRELNVRAVLMSRLIQRGDELSVSMELVDVRDNKHLWGGQYNRKLADIIAMQTEIAQDVAESLQLRLSGDEKKRLTKRYTESGEAYQLYLMGKYYTRRRTKEGLVKSIEFFDQAIKKDPSYAPAYAGLAFTYGTMGFQGVLPPKEARQKQELAALKALEIDNDLDEAHSAMAFVRAEDLNWAASEEEHQLALKLNPNSAADHQNYVYHLEWLGRLDEAMLHLKRAQELDPLSLLIGSEVGAAFYYARQYDKAIEQLQKTIEMDPSFAPAHMRLANAYQAKGMYEEAIAEHKKGIALDKTSRRVAQLGYTYATAGKRDEAQKILDELKDVSKQQYVSPFEFALIYVGLGDKDHAFAWLEKTFEERHDTLGYLKVDPRFDSFRSDPRFADLLRRMKLAT